jgi:hypothetical protein
LTPATPQNAIEQHETARQQTLAPLGIPGAPLSQASAGAPVPAGQPADFWSKLEKLVKALVSPGVVKQLLDSLTGGLPVVTMVHKKQKKLDHNTHAALPTQSVCSLTGGVCAAAQLLLLPLQCVAESGASCDVDMYRTTDWYKQYFSVSRSLTF